MTIRISVVTHRCMPFMVIPIAKNYELSGIEGYTCQTQAKTHAIVSRTHRSEKNPKINDFFKIEGGHIENEGVI